MTVKEVFGKMVNIDIPPDVFPTPEIIQTVEDEVPNCHHGWYKSVSDNGTVDLHYRWWEPQTDKPKGVVIFLHGIHSHAGHASHVDGQARDVALLVETFASSTDTSLKVYARDMYGHGFSEGTRFYIPSWQDARDDILNFIRLVADDNPSDIPIFVCGESIGGCFAVLVAKHLQDHPTEAPSNFDSCLLICPAIQGDMPPFPVYQVLRYVLAPMYPKWRPSFMPDTISPERIWKEEAVRKHYMQPCFQETQLDACGLKFRLGTALNMVLAIDEVRTKSIPGFTVPFCIVHGDADEGVPLAGSQLLYDQSSTPDDQKELHAIEGAYHGLIADPKAPEAMGHLKAFVEKRIKAFTPASSKK